MQKKSKNLFAEAKACEDEDQKQKLLVDAEFWDKQQYIRKIQLNSLYGALLNPACKMYDDRIGQSVTLSGRRIVKHMCSCVNEILTGDYNYKGDAIVYGDTDSVTGNTLVKCLINNEERVFPIEELFDMISYKFARGHKEYAVDPSIKVLTYDPKLKKPVYKTMDYVYRHNTEKELFEIELEDGKKVIVTEDHSVMVERNGILIECKPNELKEEDKFIVVNYDDIH
jgi:DNA polymerase elongation subunit (family B)